MPLPILSLRLLAFNAPVNKVRDTSPSSQLWYGPVGVKKLDLKSSRGLESTSVDGVCEPEFSPEGTHIKLGAVACTVSPSTGELETRGSLELTGQPTRFSGKL